MTIQRHKARDKQSVETTLQGHRFYNKNLLMSAHAEEEWGITNSYSQKSRDKDNETFEQYKTPKRKKTEIRPDSTDIRTGRV